MKFCCMSRSPARAEPKDAGEAADAAIARPEASREKLKNALLNPHRTVDSCGVGINFRITESGELEIESLSPHLPAERCSKLRAGDQLMRVDGRFVRGHTASHIATRVLGPAGTIVELSFKRVQGPAVMTVNVALVRETPRDQSSQHAAAQASVGRDDGAPLAGSHGIGSTSSSERPKSSERPFMYQGSTHTDWRTEFRHDQVRQTPEPHAPRGAQEDSRLKTPPRRVSGGGRGAGREGGERGEDVGKSCSDSLLSPDMHHVHRTLMEMSVVSSQSPVPTERPTSRPRPTSNN
jgi:hypothetical protein